MLTKKDAKDLRIFREKVDSFTSSLFDWAAPLEKSDLLGAMYSFREFLTKKIEELENDYWTFEDENFVIAEETFDTMDQAQDFADKVFFEKCSNRIGLRDGQRIQEDIVLIHFKYDDAGEMSEIERINSKVEYECYHGDRAEHGTWNKHDTGCF